MKFKHPTLTHGSVSQDERYDIRDGVINCPETFGRERGWTPLEDAPTRPVLVPQPLTDEQKAAREDEYVQILDAYTVSEVLRHVEDEALNTDDLQALRDVEAENKNRVSLLDALDAKLAARKAQA